MRRLEEHFEIDGNKIRCRVCYTRTTFITEDDKTREEQEWIFKRQHRHDKVRRVN
jgi:hypothetical protein